MHAKEREERGIDIAGDISRLAYTYYDILVTQSADS